MITALRINNYRLLPMECPDCHKQRLVWREALKRSKVPGLCRPCANKRGLNISCSHTKYPITAPIMRSGYIAIKLSSGCVKRATIVMTEYLGRQLAPTEYVHHINGIKTDDRLENLMVVSSTEHGQIHARGRTRDKNGRFSERLVAEKVDASSETSSQGNKALLPRT